MKMITEFARGIRGKLEEYLQPATVTFRGSFASGTFDEYSDIDLQADIQCELSGQFYTALEGFLTGLYGPALIRYDPGYREDRAAQGIRISFYELPVFWRVDLDIISDRSTETKWPQPFPEWSIGNSALMNIIWAVKYQKRDKPDLADHYCSCACDKLGAKPQRYSKAGVKKILSILHARADTDSRLIVNTRKVLER